MTITTLLSATTIDITGYYENQTTTELNDNTANFQIYNKLRLDFNKEISKKITFNSDVIFQTYHGVTEIVMLNYIPEKILSDYSQATGISIDSLKENSIVKLKNEVLLDNAFLSLYYKHFNFRIGKQPIALGSGYAWNPTDIYNTKNIFDPTYEKKGVNAIKLELPFSSEGMFTTIISPGETWKTSIKSVYLKQFWLGYDFEISYAQKQHTQANSGYTDNRNLFGFSFSGTLLGLGIWSETAFNKFSKSDDYFQEVLGTDFTFENGLYLMSEFYYNGLGKKNKSDYQFGDWIDLFAKGNNLGRDYLYLGASYPIGDFIECSTYLITNINDKSFYAIPGLTLSISDNADITLTTNIPYGIDNSEFSMLKKSVALRLKAYF